MDTLNGRLWLKRLSMLWIFGVTVRWVHLVVRHRLRWTGVDELVALRPTRGVLLVANHRSFFDMFVAISILLRLTRWTRRIYFPVRANFFYDRVLGAVLNLGIAAGSMWPPVYRDDRRDLNGPGLRQLAGVLQSPGAVVGYHPEGTRGKGPDPLQLLPAKAGVGRLLKLVDDDVLVVPLFISCLSNDFLADVRLNFKRRGQRGCAIRVDFGAARRAGDLDRSRGDQELAEEVLGWIRKIGEGVELGAPPDEPCARNSPMARRPSSSTRNTSALTG